MIKINKSNNIPDKIKNEGAKEKINDMVSFLFDSVPFITTEEGETKKEFSKSIYGHKDVKKQLKKDQHYKCCYCESKFTANSPGDVEHFRPKSAYSILDVKGLLKPGYYWLAYDWDNLFFSCEICNRTFKKNHFPLLNEEERAEDHCCSINNEKPLLICPSEDPSSHIEFDKDIIKGKDNRGNASIDFYGLKRAELLDDRLSLYMKLKNIGPLKGDPNRVTAELTQMINDLSDENYTVNDLTEIVKENNSLIENAISDNGEFSLMARINFG